MRLSITSGPLPLQAYVRARIIHPTYIIVNDPRARIRKDRRLNSEAASSMFFLIFSVTRRIT